MILWPRIKRPFITDPRPISPTVPPYVGCLSYWDGYFLCWVLSGRCCLWCRLRLLYSSQQVAGHVVHDVFTFGSSIINILVSMFVTGKTIELYRSMPSGWQPSWWQSRRPWCFIGCPQIWFGLHGWWLSSVAGWSFIYFDCQMPSNWLIVDNSLLCLQKIWDKACDMEMYAL